MRAILLAILVGAGLGCDVCGQAWKIHASRCGDGDASSCEWVQAHPVDATGVCLAE